MADAVALKLPAMWTEDMGTWFHQAEAQFELRKITDEKTRFYHVVAVLTADNAAKVKHLIRNPPQETPYTALKAALLERYEPTDTERAAAILSITSLGDAKPSQLMDRILGYLGGQEGGILLRYHFISILPDFVRHSLALSTTKDLQKLAAEADLIFLAGRDTGTQHVLEAEGEVDRVQTKPRARRPNPSSQSSKAPRSRDLCFYHARFGEKAKKCDPERCNWQGNDQAGQQM